MKITPINNKITSNYNKKNNISFGSSYANASDLLNISALIDKYDSQRLDGTIQRFYQCGDYMVKAPERNGGASAIKEFFALSKLREANMAGAFVPDCATLAKKGESDFLVEGFVKGQKASLFPYSINDTKSDLNMIMALDKTGIVNQNLSPSNIIITPDKKRIAVDFGKYTFLSDDGRVFHSQHLSPAYYTKKSPLAEFVGRDKLNSCEINSKRSVKEVFASSFLHKKNVATDNRSLLHLKNLSPNPFINLSSNLTNYEAKTIYPKIASMDIDDPILFLQDYLVAKSDYHASMRDFLSSIGTETIEADKTATDAIKESLKKPSYHEDILSVLFKNKTTGKPFLELKAKKEELYKPLNEIINSMEDAGNPQLSMQSYFAKKSDYHSAMKNFLNAININNAKGNSTAIEATKEKLKNAIEYEDFLAALFQDKSQSSYSVEFEAAKIKLQKLLNSDADKGSIHRAYQNLIRTTREGLIKFKEPKYREYLKTELERYKNAINSTKNNRATIESAKEKLKNAIEYEDFLSTLFKDEKPDSYFAKLEAAKIQLHGLLNYETKGSKFTKKHISTAYQKLISTIEEGLQVYDEPKYQKYLKTELERYKEAFKYTKFESTKQRQIIPKALDILDSLFGGASLPVESENIAKKAQKVQEIGTTILKKQEATKKAEYTLQDATDTVAKHIKQYSKEEYLKLGKKYFARLGIVLLAGGLLLKEIIQYKKDNDSNK